ncbi:DUF1876 domain-containing protein [Nonomuraea sp. K274]|uniref:DUF1876 domain-containing protein n=1 Tax=Nonomuraea cypriaca TaxID=1187855 RepID=A0A931F020_9ACTN|nr:DUF1876 domain-containing protein [Nonomuraea cypriaca]MBF8190429.1 DUF1876 domain-containing protein [Nonomuraea cypriaca]
MEAKEWSVRVHIAEEGDDTSAKATLTTRDGTRVTGEGRARRNPADPSVPEIGDELAVSRALGDLADKLAVITRHDIADSVHPADSATQNRSW